MVVAERAVGKLDYDKADIWLVTETEYERDRLNSCAKEPETVQWIEQYVKPGDTFYDIGANIGAYSLIADAQGAIVYAFEPVPSTFAHLARNVTENKARIWLIPLGVMDRPGIDVLALSSEEAGAASHRWHSREGLGTLTTTLDGAVNAFTLALSLIHISEPTRPY